MSDENQPDRGSTIAFDTKYEVRTQVDSSALADKFPEMCGSATFAIEVSSTSMNVASVTVTAITHGLIDPSGILNLASSLLRIAGSISFPYAPRGSANPLSVNTYDRPTDFLYSSPSRI